MIKVTVGNYIHYKVLATSKVYGVMITTSNQKLYEYELMAKEIEIILEH